VSPESAREDYGAIARVEARPVRMFHGNDHFDPLAHRREDNTTA
jgi:hypothetical protein